MVFLYSPGWQSGVGQTETAARLGIDYKSQFKHYASRPFEPHKIEWSSLLEQVAREEAAKIGRILSPDMLAVLVYLPEPPTACRGLQTGDETLWVGDEREHRKPFLGVSAATGWESQTVARP